MTKLQKSQRYTKIEEITKQYNMLTRAAGRACMPSDLSLDRRMMLVSTYEEFMIILTAGLLITAILNLKNK
jgi:hypothetical protein